MEFRGQRFTVDFSDDEEEPGTTSTPPSAPLPAFSSAVIGDIQERSTKPPAAPTVKSTATGFPEHKKRTKVSAFKQQRGNAARLGASGAPNTSSRPPKLASDPAPVNARTQEEPSRDEERRQIDEENTQRLAAMSAEEIEEERHELLHALSPTLIERLLKRANLDDGRGDTGIGPPHSNRTEEKVEAHQPEPQPETTPAPDTIPESTAPKKVAIEEGDEEPVPTPISRPNGKLFQTSKTITLEDDKEPADPIDLLPVSETRAGRTETSQPAVHFPSAPSAPDLDPSDPSFLQNLHTKYFPSLPADPSKLAWMAPLPTNGSLADQESPYSPAHEALAASALRFHFRGGLLPPRISRAMPSNRGLHHHGEAPEAAGYTVPELARLARSAFPAQRCVSFQTLGRLLYRLGRGEFGDVDSEIAKGLWRCVEEGKVIQTLQECANADGGHQGSKVYAIEAVWLWQKGGGKVWKAN
ncbi:hypothetical protein B7494_g6945 [Chlorociboria aeruginascens]|nr:hypothetical protein B7494_g6945 [Chlorociboria aeruginascens]